MKKMAWHSQEQQEAEPQPDPIFSLDSLFCNDERFEEDFDVGLGFNQLSREGCGENLKKTPSLLESDLFWEDDELHTLLIKERDTHLGFNNLKSDGYLMVARKEGVDWMLRVIAHYGFSASTSLLAVNYYDRFCSGLCLQRDKPWMNQLVAVACLSVAAKMEEPQVPLLLDLQVEDSKFMFEPKTILRMELLVLSTLGWKMNPATPLSFIDHIVRRFDLMTKFHLEFMRRCESVLLPIFTDIKLGRYLPSVVATATMLFVVRDIESGNAVEFQNQLINVLRISKEKMDECCKLVEELSDDCGSKWLSTHKRKYESIPRSPSGVIDSYFSSDSSNDSWSAASSVSSSPEPLYKRSRAQDQETRLASYNNACFSVGRCPH